MRFSRPSRHVVSSLSPRVILLVGCVTVGFLSLIQRQGPTLGPPADILPGSLANSHLGHEDASLSPCPCRHQLGLRPLKNRDLLPGLLEEHHLKTGIEVGVKKGEFAKVILDGWKSCQKYHLVDLWAHQENYKDIANVDDKTHDKFFRETQAALQNYTSITEYHRMYSSQAAKKFDNETIDFIYVDARHDYCGVLEDIQLYWPILKKGGIMAGHDYNENAEVRGQDWGLCGDGVTRNDLAVKGAVNDFFLPKGLTIGVTYYRQNNFMTWFVQKPLC